MENNYNLDLQNQIPKEGSTEETKRAVWELPDSVVDLIQSIVIALVIIIVMYLVIAMPNQVQGNSMEPNFSQGEIILTNKISTWLGETGIGKRLGFDYSRGDIIIFKKPGVRDHFIKRVIGEPGDTVAIADGVVYINGNVLDESEYLDESVITEGGTFIIDGDLARTIPEDSFFVLGDNRQNSNDSRTIEIGFVKKEWIEGEVELRYWPNITLFSKPDYNL